MDKASKPLIELYDSVGLGIIIEYPTGILVSNQTGGTACLHPQMEGVYLPLRNDYMSDSKVFMSPEIALVKYFEGPKHHSTGATNGIDLEDVEKINFIIEEAKLNDLIEVDLDKLAESHEAWIRILVNKEKQFGLMSGFKNYPLKGVLTWSNSD